LTKGESSNESKRDKRSAILINLLKLEISSSSLDIIHEHWGEEGYRIEFNIKTSDFKEVRQIGDPLFCGLGLRHIYRILSMNFGQMRIRSEFSSRASELGRRFEVRRVDDPLFLWTRIEASSSNIIDELWGNENTEPVQQQS